MKQTNALFLIDDSAENALSAAAAPDPPRVLLFGEYPWNAEIVPPEGEGAKHPDDGLIYTEAEKLGKLEERKARRNVRVQRGWLPPTVTRVRGWEDVVRWVEGLERGQVKL